MRIRRIGKAMRIMKEKQSTQQKVKSEDSVGVSEKTEPETGAIFSETRDNTTEARDNSRETHDNTSEIRDCDEEVHALKNDPSVLIDVSNILENNGNSIRDGGTDETMEDVENGENRKTKEDDSESQSSATEVSNECLNCGREFPDSEVSVQPRHSLFSSAPEVCVSRMEKRRQEAKRYSLKRLEASHRILEFTCGSCGEKFTAKSKLRRHITVRVHSHLRFIRCELFTK